MLQDYIDALNVAIHDRNKKQCLAIKRCLNKCGMDDMTIYSLLNPSAAQQLKDIIK